MGRIALLLSVVSAIWTPKNGYGPLKNTRCVNKPNGGLVGLTGQIQRTNYCPGCIEQILVWTICDANKYSSAPASQVATQGSRSRKRVNIRINIKSVPCTGKTYVKLQRHLQYTVS